MVGQGNSNSVQSPVVARAPGVGGWLIGARYVGPDNADVVAGLFSDAYALTSQTPRGNPLAPATPGELLKLDAGFALRPSLACETGDATPVVDLRFEELPGATEFRDSSRLGNHGTNAAGALPAAGFAAAPAPDSDFAASLRLPADIDLPISTGESTSFALWVKKDPGSTTSQRFLMVRDPQADGYQLDVRTSSVKWTAGGTHRTELADGGARPLLFDDEWHHVVVTRSAAGSGAIYVDGTPWGQGFAMDDPALGQVQIIGDGVLIDDFKMFDRALAPHEVEPLMTQTPLDRCALVAVESEATADDGRYPWAELTLTPHDPVALLLASAQLGLQVDGAAPLVSVAPVPGPVPGGSDDAPGTFILSGNAIDSGSGVARVEVKVGDAPYVLADGLDTWSFALPVVDGSYGIRIRATDAVGNVGARFHTVVVDGTAPEVSLDALPDTPVAPASDPATGAPIVQLSGSASDAVSGIATGGVEVQLVPSPSGAAATEENWQPATLDGDRWMLDYRFSTTAIDVSGAWDVRVRATDGVGNVSAHDDVAAVLRLDANAPEVQIGLRDADRRAIGGDDVLELAGQVTDADGAGITALEISLTPLATLLALPDGASTDDLPDPLTWAPVDLAESGPGVTETSWTFEIDGLLEDSYQVDLRATDALGNQAVRPNVWRGVIDTTAPRLVLDAAATGELHTGGTRFEVRYDCDAEDLFLDADSFDCDEGSDAPPVKVLKDDAALQSQFPDLPQLERMTTEFTRWERGPESEVEFTACDVFGNCTTLDHLVDDGGIPVADLSAAVVDPTDGRHVAVDGPIDLGIVAEAAASIRSLALVVDGSEVERRDFADGAVTTFNARVPVDVVGGAHTARIVVEDWAGTSKTSAPVTFFADTQEPTVSLDSTVITALDTWGAGSDTIRFHGDVVDDGTIASVEVKVEDGDWTDVIVDGDRWRGALTVPEADGTDITVQVRAFDLAGRSAAISHSASVDLGPDSPDFVAPDTVIVVGPSAETASESASFLITKIAGSNEAVSLLCSLDGGAPVPCPGLWTVDGLSSGPHRVAVAAVDSAGNQDLSPATWEWSVTPSDPRAEILSAPEDPSTDRTPSFIFSSDPGATFECRLDDADFETCTSPTTFERLPDGTHRFEVRATLSGTTGTATPHVWTIVNSAPVAQDQMVTYGVGPEGTPIELDAVDDDPITYRIVDQPEHGLLEGAGPDRTYRPATGFGGPDEFTFQAFDGDEWSNVATVALDPSVPVLTWPQPADIVYGTTLTSELLNATADVAGTFSYEPTAGTRLGAGTHTLSVTFEPDDDERYDAATSTVTITVLPKALQVTASSGSHPFGTPPPEVTPIFEGFAAGDDVTDLDVAPTCTSTSTDESPAGSYVSSCAGASDPDYEISAVDGVITVTRAPTVLELDDLSKVESLRTKSIEFSALLRSDATGRGIEGAEVAFRFSDGTPTCTAVTDADGRATCQVALTQQMRRLMLRNGEIEAVFDGTDDFLASSDSATTVNSAGGASGASGESGTSEPSGSVTAQSLGGPSGLGASADSPVRDLAASGASTDRTGSLGLLLLAGGLLLCLFAAGIRRRRSH
ncbi:LamG-like jellyroll fold domain-containing protein [Actinospongicola halichondriae]|uniref:LamG-like jellyroll fold domain-containing protein n=1 Tax=Actinospongicola halichondriae TaxID=3236844 RepID=UPI003D5052C0